MRLRKRTAPLRCAYCHDKASGDLCSCKGAHRDCARENGECPVCGRDPDQLGIPVTTRFTINVPAFEARCYDCNQRVLLYQPLGIGDQVFCRPCRNARIDKEIERNNRVAAEAKDYMTRKGGWDADFWALMGLLVAILGVLFLIGFAAGLIH